MYHRDQSNNICKAMVYRPNGLYMLVRDFASLSKTGLRRSLNFRNMSRGGVENIVAFTRRSVIRVGGVIIQKNMDALLLVPEMLIVLDRLTFKGVSLICGSN